MIEKNFHDPGTAYTASLLADYGRAHDINVDQPFIPDIRTLHNGKGAGAQAFRHGYAVAPQFEVADSVPRTMPIVLARLALFDIRMRQNPDAWPDSLDMAFGVNYNSVSWLRLVGVNPDDERVGEILSIVGANQNNGVNGIEHDAQATKYRLPNIII